MLKIANRYAHGYVAYPILLACKRAGLFDLLKQKPMREPALAEALSMNTGPGAVTLRMLESLGWIRRNPDGYIHVEKIAERAKDLDQRWERVYAVSVEQWFDDPDLATLGAEAAERSARRWDTADERWADMLDGVMLAPLWTALYRARQTAGPDDAKPWGCALPETWRQTLEPWFQSRGWSESGAATPCWTPAGRYLTERAMIFGTAVSYRSLLSRMHDLLFGDFAAVFARADGGDETHVERILNVLSSGFQHERYFNDLNAILTKVFDRKPYTEQPRAVVDMGCGDGSLLRRLFEFARDQTERGKCLDRFPLAMIGVDFNRQALDVADRRLADLPHLMLEGDIGDPARLLADLNKQGYERDDLWHVRSFLDHDRPYRPPESQPHPAWAAWAADIAATDAQGRQISGVEAIQSLIEHFERWHGVIGRHGLTTLEVHSLPARVTQAHIDECENLHFDAFHGFSRQHLAPAPVYLLAAAASGLFPCFAESQRYPRPLPFTRITLTHFERRPFRLQPLSLDDLPALIALEERHRLSSLRTPPSVIEQRLRQNPGGHFALQQDGRIVAAIYTQRIDDEKALRHTPYDAIHTLSRPHGRIGQLVMLQTDRAWSAQGLGHLLRQLMIGVFTCDAEIDKVVGITRCSNYAPSADISMDDYIRLRDEQGLPTDATLRFHAEGGAAIGEIVPQYRPEDTDNGGAGVWIEYRIREEPGGDPEMTTEREPGGGAIRDRVERCILQALGESRQSHYAPHRPLMEMDLDSLDLMTLNIALNRFFGLELEPAFFFRYGTPEAITAYIESADTHSSAGTEPLRAARRAAPSAKPGLAQRPPLSATPLPIAIAGMACRFPGGADTLEAYWDILRDGRDVISNVPSDRWTDADLEAYDLEPAWRSALRQGGFLQDVYGFDPFFFKITPNVAKEMDPQQRLLLEVVWEALENAGLAPDRLKGRRVGVFMGLSFNDYEAMRLRIDPRRHPLDLYFATGNSHAIAAGRIAYFLGVQGPTLAVDTACSSSMAAIHLACRSLQAGECEWAIAGGANLLLAPHRSVCFARAGMLSPRGRCHVFDAEADGYVRSEGGGAVVLTSLDLARRDGHPIVAVIRGSAMNHDGASNGLTAPNGNAQEDLLRDALRDAGLRPGDIDYLETHGTGTALGDPVECGAIEQVFAEDAPRERPLWLGSVKTNIGHTEAAAGVASLIKTALALQQATIPPHLHRRAWNPQIHVQRLPADTPSRPIPWPSDPANTPRRAGISSFGFSGTNVHVVLEESPPPPPYAAPPVDRAAHVLPLSAATDRALRTLAGRYADRLKRTDDEWPDIAYSAATGRAHGARRLAVTAADANEASEALRDWLGGHAAAPVHVGQAPVSGHEPVVAFLFSGQGTQYAHMGREWYETQPTFRETMDRCAAAADPYLDRPLISVLYGEQAAETLAETLYTQTALCALEISLARLWSDAGIVPQIVMGHSLGEYAAACVAGAYDPETAMALTAQRARLLQSLPSGGEMFAAAAAPDVVEDILRVTSSDAVIAACNGPSNTVVSGARDTVRTAQIEMKRRGIAIRRLAVSHAFHSPLVQPIADEFRRVMTAYHPAPLRVPLVSLLTGNLADADFAQPDYWTRHLLSPVRFESGLRSLQQFGATVFLEIGPKPMLIDMGRQVLTEPELHWLSSLRPGVSDAREMLSSLATLYTLGCKVNWNGLDVDYPRRRVRLPNYPFDRQPLRCDDPERSQSGA